MSDRTSASPQEIYNEQRIYDIVHGVEQAEGAEEIRLLKWYAEEKLAIIESRKLTEIEINQRGVRDQIFEWYFTQDYESKKLLELFLNAKHDYIAQVSSPEIGELREEMAELNNNLEIAPEELIQLQKAAMNNSMLMSQMKKMWARIENNKLILPEGFDKTPEHAQMQRYMKAISMTLNPEYTSDITPERRAEKIKLYLDTVQETGDAVMGKEYLWYKLIHSINEDLKREWYILIRDGLRGQYGIYKFPIKRKEIREPETTKANGETVPGKITGYGDIISDALPSDHPYAEMLGANLKDDYLDFAITYSLIEGNHTAFKQKEFLGQATLVKTIIDNYGITGISAEDLQDPNLLIADWKDVEAQIDTKLKIYTTIEAYEELMYLKNLIGWKEYISKDRNLRLFREVNTYGKGFLLEKALIDERLNIHGWAGSKDSLPQTLKDTIWNNFPLIAIASILTMLFGWESKKLGGYALIWSIAAMAGLWMMEDMTWELVDDAKAGDMLELVKMKEITREVSSLSDEQSSVYHAMIRAKNAQISTRKVTKSKGETLYTRNDSARLSNEKIAAIFEKLAHTETDIPLSLDGSIDEDVIGKVVADLGITGTTENVKLWKEDISKDDIRGFLSLLSGIKDDKDTNIRDTLTSWIDILSKPFERVNNITWVAAFDDSFNTFMKESWDTEWNTRKAEREKVEALQTLLKRGNIKKITSKEEYFAYIKEVMSARGIAGEKYETLIDGYLVYLDALNVFKETKFFNGKIELQNGYISGLEKLFGIHKVESRWAISEGLSDYIPKLEAARIKLDEYTGEYRGHIEPVQVEMDTLIAKLKIKQQELIREATRRAWGETTEVLAQEQEALKFWFLHSPEALRVEANDLIEYFYGNWQHLKTDILWDGNGISISPEFINKYERLKIYHDEFGNESGVIGLTRKEIPGKDGTTVQVLVDRNDREISGDLLAGWWPQSAPTNAAPQNPTVTTTPNTPENVELKYSDYTSATTPRGFVIVASRNKFNEAVTNIEKSVKKSLEQHFSTNKAIKGKIEGFAGVTNWADSIEALVEIENHLSNTKDLSEEYKKAKSLFGDTFTIANSDITIEDLQDLYAKKKTEIATKIETSLGQFNISEVKREDMKKVAGNLHKINTIFDGRFSSIIWDLNSGLRSDLMKKYFLNTPLSEEASLNSAIKTDLQKVTDMIDTWKNEDYLLDIRDRLSWLHNASSISKLNNALLDIHATYTQDSEINKIRELTSESDRELATLFNKF